MGRALFAAGHLLLVVVVVAGCRAEPQDFANQTNITVWTCNNSTGQKWYMYIIVLSNNNALNSMQNNIIHTTSCSTQGIHERFNNSSGISNQFMY